MTVRMGLPTVRDVWRLALPATSRLAGGEAGLGRLASWARRMAVHPPAFAALEEGEIALLSVESLQLLDERLTLGQVVRAVSDLQAAALAIVGEPTDQVGAIADAQELPLFLLPPNTDLRDVERDIIRLIVEHEAQLDRRGRELTQHLTQISIGSGGLTTIAEGLLTITGKPVLVQDARLAIQAAAWPDDAACTLEALTPALQDDAPMNPLLWASRPDPGAPPCQELGLGDSGWARYVAAIFVEAKLEGYLSLVGPPQGLDELDRLAVQHGALVCAMELAKQRAVAAAEDRLRGDFLDVLLTAEPTQHGTLARRLLEMGYRLEGQHTVCILSLGQDSAQLLTFLAGEFRALLLNTGVQMLLCPYEGNVVALCNADDVVALKRVEEAARAVRDQRAQASPLVRIAAGIGKAGAGLAGLRRSFSQAREAVALAHSLFGGDQVLTFSDLGAYALLCRLQSSEELGAFYEQTLAPLAEYDARHDSHLVQTLDAFLAHLGNVSQTAEGLYLHRNSLLYRLERIGEITGLDLDDADDRFALQLALKMRPLLPTPSAT